MEPSLQAIQSFNDHAQEVKGQHGMDAHAENALQLSQELTQLRWEGISKKAFTSCYQQVVEEVAHVKAGNHRDGMIVNMADVVENVSPDKFSQYCDHLAAEFPKMDSKKSEHLKAVSYFAEALLNMEQELPHHFEQLENESQRIPPGAQGLEDLHNTIATLLTGLPPQDITEDRITRSKEHAENSAEHGDNMKKILTDAEFIAGKLQRQEVESQSMLWRTAACPPGTYSARFLRRDQINDERSHADEKDVMYLNGDFGNPSTGIPPSSDSLPGGFYRVHFPAISSMKTENIPQNHSYKKLKLTLTPDGRVSNCQIIHEDRHHDARQHEREKKMDDPDSRDLPHKSEKHISNER